MRFFTALRSVQNDRVEGGAAFRMTGLRASPAFASLRVPLRCAKGTFAQPTSFRRKPESRGAGQRRMAREYH